MSGWRRPRGACTAQTLPGDRRYDVLLRLLQYLTDGLVQERQFPHPAVAAGVLVILESALDSRAHTSPWEVIKLVRDRRWRCRDRRGPPPPLHAPPTPSSWIAFRPSSPAFSRWRAAPTSSSACGRVACCAR